MRGGSAAGASLTSGAGAGARTGGMALHPVLRNLQQSRGAMQPGAPEDPVQHDPWPCMRTQQCTPPGRGDMRRFAWTALPILCRIPACRP